MIESLARPRCKKVEHRSVKAATETRRPVKLLQLLLRCFSEVVFSQGMLVLVFTTSVISGATAIAFIRNVNFALSSGLSSDVHLISSVAVLSVVSCVSGLISEVVLVGLTEHATLRMRLQLAQSVLSAPLRLVERLGPSKIIVVLTDDIQVVANVLSLLPNLCISYVIVAGTLVYLGLLSKTGLVLVCGFMLGGSCLYRLLGRAAAEKLRHARQDQDVLVEHYRTLTQGIKELKLHSSRRSRFVNGVLRHTARSVRDSNTSGLTRYLVAGRAGQLTVFLLIVLLISLGPALLSGSGLMAFTLTIMYVIGPFSVIINSFPHINKAVIAVQSIEGLRESLQAEADQGLPTPLADPKTIAGVLELSEVTYTYRGEPGDLFVVGPINVSFKPGELVFLIGGNGSGKTTVAKILVGLYSPESGEIWLDGKRVYEHNMDSYRAHFSAVFSDFCCFDSLLGVGGADLDERASAYLGSLHLAAKVRVRDGAFSTTELSQGQRKRLALLTAYMEDRAFYVFDEWAADQDPCFKEIFYRQLLPELKTRGKTVLVITHDERYFGQADRVIKLEGGRVVLSRHTEAGSVA